MRIRDRSDQPAWSEFVEVYGPLIHRYGLHHGLQDADAADLTQEVLQAVMGACERFEYDPRRGSFRGWLFTITRNKLVNLRSRKQQVSGGTVVKEMLAGQPTPESHEEEWNRQHLRRLFEWAAEAIRGDFQESTWHAFWQTCVQNHPAAEVAERLDLSVGAVYIAKSRVLARLKEKIRTIEEE